MKPHVLSVVLTGGADPVAAAIARALVRRGARVLLVSRHAEALVALARELAPPEDHRYRFDALAADIATPHGCRAVLDAAVARDVNALVNVPDAQPGGAHGGSDPPPVDVLAADAIAATMRITRTLLPHLRSRPDARVLTIGLSFVDGASADPATIRANQDALRGASEALRREVAGGSVRMQFLGRRAITRALDPGTTAEHGAATSRVDRPQYVASVAVQMLLAGTRERFLGTPGDLMGRVNAVLGALFHTAPKHRRA